MKTRLAVLPIGLLSMLAACGTRLDELGSHEAEDETSQVEEAVTTFQRTVLVLNYDPILESRGSVRVSKALGMNDSNVLAQAYAADMKTVSGGRVRYAIREVKNLDEFPVKLDGFRYDDASYLACHADRTQCHGADAVDYAAIISKFDLCRQVETGKIDEVWLFGGPYFGYYESTMAGDTAFWINSPKVPNVRCSKNFVLMGFNYERGVESMLHDFGHRLEGTMTRTFALYSRTNAGETPYQIFSKYDAIALGEARVGNTHFPPNARYDYDYGNTTQVPSRADSYFKYPNLSAAPKPINCAAWSCNEHGYMKWMLSHVPRGAGKKAGYENDWWKYLVDFNRTIDDALNCPGYTDQLGCTKHRSCRWAATANACVGATEPDPVPNSCASHTTVAACDAAPGCAFYFCSSSCWPRGTANETACR